MTEHGTRAWRPLVGHRGRKRWAGLQGLGGGARQRAGAPVASSTERTAAATAFAASDVGSAASTAAADRRCPSAAAYAPWSAGADASPPAAACALPVPALAATTSRALRPQRAARRGTGPSVGVPVVCGVLSRAARRAAPRSTAEASALAALALTIDANAAGPSKLSATAATLAWLTCTTTDLAASGSTWVMC